MRKTLLWLALTAPLSMTAYAQTDTQTANSTANAAEFANTQLGNSLDNLSQEEKSLARQWMLTDQDWVKYKNIMSGPRGTWSPGLDPLTALGVMETDPAERRRYAEIWMRMEIRRAELELAFEVERMGASERILRGRPVVNNQSWIEQWNAQQAAQTHSVMLFVDSSCVDKCGELYKEVLESTGADQTASLNIFFPSGTEAEAIGKWAQSVGIDPEIVRSRKVTLNFDKGEYAQYDIASEELPEVRVLNLKTGDVQRTFTRW